MPAANPGLWAFTVRDIATGETFVVLQDTLDIPE